MGHKFEISFFNHNMLSYIAGRLSGGIDDNVSTIFPRAKHIETSQIVLYFPKNESAMMPIEKISTNR